MLNSLLIVASFISVFPAPIRDWNGKNLRYFCLMLPIVGFAFGTCWWIMWLLLVKFSALSEILRGFLMTLCTLALTGGLHMDGLMDTCDAIFSRRDRQTRLKILSDTHAGSFAVMGCVIVLMAKTLLFAELFSRDVNLFFVPVYSRLGMGVLLNNLPFAKSDGLAVMLGSSRNSRDNYFFALMFIVLLFVNQLIAVTLAASFIIWSRVCTKIFGGITGDLLGAFVEISELFILMIVVFVCA